MIITNINNFSYWDLHAVSDHDNEYDCDFFFVEFDLCCDFDPDDANDDGDGDTDGTIMMMVESVISRGRQ